MAEFIFNCPFCKKEIGADTAWIGRSSECPHCLSMIVIKKDVQKKIEQPKLVAIKPSDKQVDQDGKENKSKLVYFLLWLLLPGFGAHKFYVNDIMGAIFRVGLHAALWMTGVIPTMAQMDSANCAEPSAVTPFITLGLAIATIVVWCIDFGYPKKDTRFNWND